MSETEHKPKLPPLAFALPLCVILAFLGTAIGFVVPYFDFGEAPFDRDPGCYNSPEVSALLDRQGPLFFGLIAALVVLFVVGAMLRENRSAGSFGLGLAAVFGSALVLGGMFDGYEIGRLPYDCVSSPTPGPILTGLVAAICAVVVVGATRRIKD